MTFPCRFPSLPLLDGKRYALHTPRGRSREGNLPDDPVSVPPTAEPCPEPDCGRRPGTGPTLVPGPVPRRRSDVEPLARPLFVRGRQPARCLTCPFATSGFLPRCRLPAGIRA